MRDLVEIKQHEFYSHVNYSVTKIGTVARRSGKRFYSHVNYSVTKIMQHKRGRAPLVLQSRKLFSY